MQDIHNEMAAHMSGGAGGGAAGSLARAQVFERGNDFVRAVDAYLSLTPADVESLDILQQCWEQVRKDAWHVTALWSHCMSQKSAPSAHGSTPTPQANLRMLVTMQATTITMQHLRHKLPDVVAGVTQRLVGVGRIAAAADLQESINDVQGEPGSACRARLDVQDRAVAQVVFESVLCTLRKQM